MNWRRLLNKKPDLGAESFPIFNISVTKIVQKDTSRVFMMPSPDAMNFIATVNGGLIYLSSPYSSGGIAAGDHENPSPVGRCMAGAVTSSSPRHSSDQWVQQTRRMFFILMNMGVTIVSPTVSGIGMYPFGGEENHDWWVNRDLKLLRKCDCVAVLVLDGWEKSSGVQQEVELATILGKPIYLIRETQ